MDPIPLREIEDARARLDGIVMRTPLLRLETDDPADRISIKLENLQPIGSFKLRGAVNALALADPDAIAKGVVTASAGNMAQGLAWAANHRGVACRVVVPDHAPRTKLEAIERLGGSWLAVPFDRWWRTLEERGHEDLEGYFVHPVSERPVIAGNGTIGLEILEDLPDVATILVPFGGGGLSSGIASALRACKPDVRIVACEVETAAPLSAARAAGHPVAIDYRESFVDGIGGRSVLPEMWPLVSKLIDDTVVVTLDEIEAAIHLLATRHRVIAEGAGAASVAAALSGRAGAGAIACVVSGGNLDATHLARILGATPG